MTNCPNCGAPIISSQCEYCGTRFPNWTVEPLAENEEIVKLVRDGLITPNEARERLGLKAELERRRHKLDFELINAKTKAMAEKAQMEKLYEDALRAMRAYSSKF